MLGEGEGRERQNYCQFWFNFYWKNTFYIVPKQETIGVYLKL